MFNQKYQKNKIYKKRKSLLIHLEENMERQYELLDEGIELENQGDFDSAEQKYDQVIKINNSNAAAFVGLAQICKRKNQIYEALENYSKSIKLDPQYYRVYNLKGNIHFDKGEHDEALECYAEAVKLNPNFSMGYNNLGNTYKSLGYKELALNCYNQAIKINPKNVIANYNMAVELEENDQVDEALLYYNKVVELNPKFIMAYAMRGKLYQQQGNIDLAIQDIKFSYQLLEQGITGGPLSQGNISCIKNVVNNLKKLEDQAEQLREQVKLINANSENKKINDMTSNIIKKFKTIVEITAIRQIANNIGNKKNEKEQVFNREDDDQTIEEKASIIIKDLKQDIKQEIPNLNKEELLKLLEEKEKKISELQAIILAKDKKFDDFEKRLNKQEKKQDEQDKDLELLKQNQEQQNDKIQQLDSDMKDSGVQELANLRRDIQELQNQDEEVYCYYNTFYWTSLNMLLTYRCIATGKIQIDLDSGEPEQLEQKENVLKDAMETSLVKNIGKEVLKAIPGIGKIYSAIDNIVDCIAETYSERDKKIKKEKFKNRVNAINNVLTKKFTFESDISLRLAQVGVELAKHRNNEIEYPIEVQVNSTWFENQIVKIENILSAQNDNNKRKSVGTNLALKDVSLLLSYIAQQSNAIIQNKKSITRIVVDLAQNKRLENMISQSQTPENQQNNVVSHSKCCSIF